MTVEPAPDSEPPFLDMFLDSAEQLLGHLAQDVERLHRAPSGPEAVQVLKALRHGFHALRGNSSFVTGCPITPIAHRAEEAVEAACEGRLDPRLLLDPLAGAIDCCTARLVEYRRMRAPGGADPREAELVASLKALAHGVDAGMARGGDTGRTRPGGPRYLYAGHDVTEILELLLTRHEASETGGSAEGESSEERIAQAQKLLQRLATASGDHDLGEFIAAGGGASGELLRLLVRRVERVAGERVAGQRVSGQRVADKGTGIKRSEPRSRAKKKPH